MRQFVPGGPKRYDHQVRGLKRLLATGGNGALLFEPGCLAGDTDLVVNRGGKSFHITLRDLVHMQNGGGRGRWGHQTWDLSIPTLVQRRADDGTVRLVRLVNAWSSGVKPTFVVTTQSGRSIRATDEHPFLTPGGWVRLDHLCVGGEVYVNGGQAGGGERRAKPKYKMRAGLRHHPHAIKRDAKVSPYQVAEHRLVVEAAMNRMPLRDYTMLLRLAHDPRRLRGLLYLRPEQVVHHRDLDPTNNALDNLQVLADQAEHNRVHRVAGRVLYKTVVDTVVSVEPYGEEETFDIEVEDDPHNFIANEFVVHNTGKTATTLDYASLLALKLEPGEDGVREARVLVVCPIAALDTWVTQSQVYCSPDIDVWAEVLGGSIREKAAALASRGTQDAPERAGGTPGRPRGFQGRTEGLGRSELVRTRSAADAPVTAGPDALGSPVTPEDPYGRPRLVLVIVNFDAFSSRMPVGSKTMADVLLGAVKAFSPDLVVVDEAHKIKSASSNVSRLMARVGAIVPRRVILTGTVMPAGPLDVFAQWRFMEPYVFGNTVGGVKRTATYTGFRDRYCVMGGWQGYQVVGYKNLDDLQEKMALNAEVVKKSEALDLPPTSDVEIPVTLSAAERKAYASMLDDLAAQLDSGTLIAAPNRLTQMLRLRQITSGHLPDDAGNVRTVGSSKVQAITSLVNDTLLGEKRVVVFCYFRHEIDALARSLAVPVTGVATTVETISGNTSQEERVAIRSRFGDLAGHPERIVLVAQMRTMSLAVNELVTASHAVFGSLSQQRDEYVQSRDRLDRIGQTLPVTFWYAIAPGTVDEVVLNSHRDRTDLEAAMLNYIRTRNATEERENG